VAAAAAPTAKASGFALLLEQALGRGDVDSLAWNLANAKAEQLDTELARSAAKLVAQIPSMRESGSLAPASRVLQGRIAGGAAVLDALEALFLEEEERAKSGTNPAAWSAPGRVSPPPSPHRQQQQQQQQRSSSSSGVFVENTTFLMQRSLGPTSPIIRNLQRRQMAGRLGLGTPAGQAAGGDGNSSSSTVRSGLSFCVRCEQQRGAAAGGALYFDGPCCPGGHPAFLHRRAAGVGAGGATDDDAPLTPSRAPPLPWSSVAADSPPPLQPAAALDLVPASPGGGGGGGSSSSSPIAAEQQRASAAQAAATEAAAASMRGLRGATSQVLSAGEGATSRQIAERAERRRAAAAVRQAQQREREAARAARTAAW
jgi:hypothetical protein